MVTRLGVGDLNELASEPCHGRDVSPALTGIRRIYATKSDVT